MTRSWALELISICPVKGKCHDLTIPFGLVVYKSLAALGNEAVET